MSSCVCAATGLGAVAAYAAYHPTPRLTTINPPAPTGGLFIFTASNAMFNSGVEAFNGFGALATMGGACIRVT